jgi:predicted RND superfamily exporter protein
MSSFASLIRRHPGKILGVTAALTVISIMVASGLKISTDLAAVLPRGYSSVEDLHKLLGRIGGSASLTVVIESPNSDENRAFADRLAARLANDPEVVTVDYKVDALREFYEKHAAVYLSLDELKKIEHDLKLRASPLPYELDLDDDPLELKNELDRYPGGYFGEKDGKFLAMFVRPRSSGADPTAARAFIDRVQRAVDVDKPAGVKVEYTGAYQISLDEQKAIAHDLVSTAGLCVALIALAVTIYFRRIRAILLLSLTLASGCAFAFALARLTIGYLNVQTAFLGSIIAGTGINYGIMLLARYFEARKSADEASALRVAMSGTLVATITAAATTAVSFGTLYVARISSFRQFALIGGSGIFFCWILSFTFLPAALVVSDRLWPVKGRSTAKWPEILSSLPVLHPRWVATVSVVAAIAGVIGFVRFLPGVLETDGRKLRNRSSETSGSAMLDERVSRLRGGSMTPAFIVTDSLEESRRVCQVLNARPKTILHSCKSIDSLLPDHQDEKLVIARRIASLQMNDPRVKRLDLNPVTLASLPEPMTRPFRELDGHVGRVVAVDPPEGRDLWIAENLFAFTNAIRKVDLGDKSVTSSGDSVIFADILREIARDAPRTTALSLFAVILLVGLVLRNRGTLHVVFALLVGVSWMIGLQALLCVKLNFFNFVALPTTFGIAVDYAINIWERWRRTSGRPEERIHTALRATGGAVFLCSLTTIIGYSTLIIADNRALASFGTLAILGELTCVLASLLVLPATMRLDSRADRLPR